MRDYLSSIIKQFRYYKELADKTFDQINDTDIDWRYNPESNSISILAKHIAGNLRSRFTNFLSEDGEKNWRKRDDEFVAGYDDKKELQQSWDDAWRILFSELDALKESDLNRIVYIRNQGHTVAEALNRQLAHYAYHVGQIVMIGKMIRNEKWSSLSIPKGQSEIYNKEKFGKEKGRRHFTEDL
ncbi:MAG: DUF1572 family protein [Flavobacteriaceae bacterium]|nr:DUF1572 domain-containing protein [Bacteroidia bacterium]MBT8288171.1 DUF1572 domain-containing protein [Bacteroidia bacterium]NNF73828.1 DUF1572 family protein [Flavobacteriaceae bacterium]NNK71573.1 DUF1572 family protein [Flavobacteriaceae bacterium]